MATRSAPRSRGSGRRRASPIAHSEAYDRDFDLHPDGDRFALAAAQEVAAEARQDKLVFVFNFFEELRRVAPVAAK